MFPYAPSSPQAPARSAGRPSRRPRPVRAPFPHRVLSHGAHVARSAVTTQIVNAMSPAVSISVPLN
jgi:hypothetical protein